MKSNLQKELLKLVLAEIFIQIGFEKCTEQAMNMATDLLVFYMESLIKHVKLFSEHSPKDAIHSLFFKFYYLEQYQREELLQFAIQQAQFKKVKKDKVDDSNNMLYMLKVLPPEIYFRNTQKNNNNLTIEEKNSTVKVIEKAKVDEFLHKFIADCKKIEATKEKREYGSNVSSIITNENEQGEILVSLDKIYNIIYDQKPVTYDYGSKKEFNIGNYI